MADAPPADDAIAQPPAPAPAPTATPDTAPTPTTAPTSAPAPAQPHPQPAPTPTLHTDPQPLDAPSDAPPKPIRRSWRRKYRKMRIKFDNAMSRSNRLIMEEWQAMGTARRLQAENDLFLDALLDFNSQPRVSARLRYNLSAHPVPDHHPDHTLRSLIDLEATVPHTTHADLPPHPIDGLDLSEHAPGYMSPAHEDEYLLAVDQNLDDPAYAAAVSRGRPPRVLPAHPPLSEKSLTVRNPDSVYSWLRKHQPQVFLQDKDAPHPENMSEKSAAKPAAASRSHKRQSAVGGGGGTPGPREHDDDDSTAADTSKGRRKTGGGGSGGGGGGNGVGGGGGGGDDDAAYRPKGGSSRPTKRKREEGEPIAKGRKKNRPSTSTPA